jgi:NADPH:quinone reductase-like Zn-dependent oxidoreductase
VVDHDDLVPVPHFLQDRLPDAQVIPIVLNYATAYQMLHREALTHNALGKKVFATGLSGGIGLALLDLAKHMDMTIYGTASASKHELVRAAGGIPIDYKKDNVEEYVKKAEPEGVDFAFDALGANWSKMSWRLLRKGGKLITFGVTATTSAIGGFGAFILPSLLGMLPGGSGTFYGITSLYKKNKNLFKNDLVVLLEMLADKKINPLVDSVIPLAEAKTGLAKLVNGDVQGKIVIKVAE